MIKSKIHIVGLRPRKILQVKNLNTIIFQGEYGYTYDFDISSQRVRFIPEDSEYKTVRYKDSLRLADEAARCFCGLMLDYTFLNENNVICCTSEGIVHWLSNSSKSWIVLHELRVTLDRLISLCVYDDQLFLLSHTGNLYQISLSALCSCGSSVSLSGIWDFCTDEAYLYSGSADGKLSIYDKNMLTFFTSYPLKAGWINAVHKGFLCTSTGAIYSFDKENGVAEVYYEEGKYWFNDLFVEGNIIVAVTAEGFVLCFGLSGNLIFKQKVSAYQLISIDCYHDKLYIASVGGEIFISQLTNDSLDIYIVCKMSANFTCIRIADERIFAATTKGEVYVIDLLHDGTIPLNNSNSLRLLSFANSRIWKLAVFDNYIYGGSVSGEIFRLHVMNLSAQMCKTNHLITSLILNGNSVILGTREGSVHACNISDMKTYTPALKNLPYSVQKFSYEAVKSSYDEVVHLHISDRIDFNGRLISFLASGQYVFQIEQHSSDEQITNIEWWKYPYITFGPRFLASGLLLDEFYKQHVIERLLNDVDTR